MVSMATWVETFRWGKSSPSPLPLSPKERGTALPSEFKSCACKGTCTNECNCMVTA
jgi:hypothetical protein